MDVHFSEILTASIQNQIADLDADIRFTYEELTDYLSYSVTIGYICKFTCNTLYAGILSKFDMCEMGESVSFTSEDGNYEIDLDDNPSTYKLKNYKFVDVLTFYRLCLKKFKTDNSDLIKMLTVQHFKMVCDYYHDKADNLILFLYLRMNVRVLNIPYKFPAMYLTWEDIDYDMEGAEAELETRYLEFTTHNVALTGLVQTAIDNSRYEKIDIIRSNYTS